MVHYLIIPQIVMINVFSFESPLQIKATRIFVFIFDPASLFQGFFDVAVTTPNNEDFCIVWNPILFAPSRHICYVQENIGFWDVSLNEWLECLVIMLNFDFRLFFSWWCVGLLLFFLFFFFGFLRRRILYLLELIHYFPTVDLFDASLTIKLVLFSLLLGFFLFF